MQDCSQMLAVIGAGPVGLAIAKGLKAHGVAYEQLEADDDVGGNWYHGVYETAHIISSKKTTECSDYPMPADYPDFPTRQTTHLINPHEALRKMRLARLMLPLLARKERRLRRKLKGQPIARNWSVPTDPDLQVY